VCCACSLSLFKDVVLDYIDFPLLCLPLPFPPQPLFLFPLNQGNVSGPTALPASVLVAKESTAWFRSSYSSPLLTLVSVSFCAASRIRRRFLFPRSTSLSKCFVESREQSDLVSASKPGRRRLPSIAARFP